MGRNAAGESFLKGFLMHSGPADSIWIYSESEEDVENFRHLVKNHSRAEKVIPVNKKKYGRLREALTFYTPGPDLASLAWQRRFFGDHAWSICGITHTTASAAAMDCIVDLISSPVRPWDGLICPSTAVKGHVLNIIEAQKEYLKDENGAELFSLPQMPVIPLGVHLKDFSFSERQRQSSRMTLAIEEHEVVVLYVGRLSFHAKAHPLQMYQALEAAAEKTSKKLVLIECGWFANDHIKNAFSSAAEKICPSVRIIKLDGRAQQQREQAWSCADIFCSLSDNIQETFGIVPLEGMAAGLPVVVSDWNGYKDSVLDGVEGYRVPSISPEPGLESDLAYRHAMGIDTYDMYCGFSSAFVGINTEILVDVFCRLIEDKNLRLSMGHAGREKVKSTYDWIHIIKRYEEFWEELSLLRKNSTKMHSVKKLQPRFLDPSQAFSHYPTQVLGPDTLLSLIHTDKKLAIDLVSEYRKLVLLNFVDELLPTDAVVEVLINSSSDKPKKAREIVRELDKSSNHLAYRALAWLVKLGIYKFK